MTRYLLSHRVNLSLQVNSLLTALPFLPSIILLVQDSSRDKKKIVSSFNENSESIYLPATLRGRERNAITYTFPLCYFAGLMLLWRISSLVSLIAKALSVSVICVLAHLSISVNMHTSVSIFVSVRHLPSINVTAIVQSTGGTFRHYGQALSAYLSLLVYVSISILFF